MRICTHANSASHTQACQVDCEMRVPHLQQHTRISSSLVCYAHLPAHTYADSDMNRKPLPAHL